MPQEKKTNKQLAHESTVAITCACIENLFGVRAVKGRILEDVCRRPASFMPDCMLTRHLRNQELIADDDTAYLAGRGEDGFEVAISSVSSAPGSRGKSIKNLNPWFHWEAYLPLSGSERYHVGYIDFRGGHYEFGDRPVIEMT